MHVAAVILNWNQADATLRAAGALRAWARPPDAVWIVDNASTDASRTRIPARCPEARYLYSEVNRGFAGGVNLALRRALESPAEAVLILNNDAALPEDAARRLQEALAADPRLAAVGPLLDESDGARPRLTAGGRDIDRRFETRIRVKPSGAGLAGGDAVRPVDYVPGAAALVRAAAFRSVGLFDEAYFFSGEMADLCRRARVAGWHCAIFPRAVAVHEPGAGAIRSTLYRYYTLRNRFLFVSRHEPERRRRLFAFWTACGVLMAALAYVRGRPAQARAAWWGLRDGLAGRFGNRNELFGVL